MQRKFIDRQREMNFLQNEYSRQGATLVVVYGRKRIGKTSLIKEFIKDKPAVYFLACEEFQSENIKQFTALVADFTGREDLRGGNEQLPLDTACAALCDYLPEQKKVLVIDEFQYLGKVNPAFPAAFHRIWENVIKDNNVMVILCGSLITMMKNQTLDLNSPLYSSKKGELRLSQIEFQHYRHFFPDKEFDELVHHYAVTGGVPRYIEMFSSAENIYEAILENILRRQSFLYEEPLFLLQREVGEVGRYCSILKVIAAGYHKLGYIASLLDVRQSALTKYIQTLISMGIVARQVPVTEARPEKSNRGLYYIKDHFIDFWFKFVFPYKGYLEMENFTPVLQYLRTTFVSEHVAFVYRVICAQSLRQMSQTGQLGFMPERFGGWWDGKQSIPLVALHEQNQTILFGSSHFNEGLVGTQVYQALQTTARNVNWHSGSRREIYAIFSNQGFADPLYKIAEQDNRLLLIDHSSVEKKSKTGAFPCLKNNRSDKK